MSAPTVIELDDTEKLEHEVKKLLTVFEQKESEETWLLFDESLKRFLAITKGSYKLPNFIACVRKLRNPINDCLVTERTRLSRTALEIVEEMAKLLKESFEAIADVLIPPVFKLCTRANKVFVTCATNCILSVIANSHIPNMLPVFFEAYSNASKSFRISAAAFVCRCLECTPIHRLESYIDVIEAAIRNGVLDATPDVRETSRKCFDIYKSKFEGRLERFISSLPDTAKKNLKLNQGPEPVKRVNFRQRLNQRDRPAVKEEISIHVGPRQAQQSSSLIATAAENMASVAEDSTPAHMNGTARNPFTEMATPSARARGKASVANFLRELLPEPTSASTPSMHHHSNHLTSASNVSSSAADILSATKATLASIVARRSEQAANRGDMSRMRTLGGGPDLTEHNGGPQRVLRTMNNDLAERKKGSGPMRVLKAVEQAEEVAPVEAEIEHASEPTAAPQPKSRPATAVTSPIKSSIPQPITSATTTSSTATTSSSLSHNTLSNSTEPHKKPDEDLAAIYNDAMRNVGHSSWLSRTRAFESLSNWVKLSSAHDLERKGAKVAEAYMNGMTDSHFKVLQVATSGALQYLEKSNGVNTKFIEGMVPRLYGILSNQQNKSKVELCDTCNRAIAKVKEFYSGEALVSSCLQMLHDSLTLKQWKVKLSVLQLLSDAVEADEEGFVAKGHHIRTILTRLVPHISDSEVAVKDTLKKIFVTMAKSHAALFATAAGQLKMNDQKVLKAFVAKELEALAKSGAVKSTSGIPAPVGKLAVPVSSRTTSLPVKTSRPPSATPPSTMPVAQPLTSSAETETEPVYEEEKTIIATEPIIMSPAKREHIASESQQQIAPSAEPNATTESSITPPQEELVTPTGTAPTTPPPNPADLERSEQKTPTPQSVRATDVLVAAKIAAVSSFTSTPGRKPAAPATPAAALLRAHEERFLKSVNPSLYGGDGLEEVGGGKSMYYDANESIDLGADFDDVEEEGSGQTNVLDRLEGTPAARRRGPFTPHVKKDPVMLAEMQRTDSGMVLLDPASPLASRKVMNATANAVVDAQQYQQQQQQQTPEQTQIVDKFVNSLIETAVDSIESRQLPSAIPKSELDATVDRMVKLILEDSCTEVIREDEALLTDVLTLDNIREILMIDGAEDEDEQEYLDMLMDMVASGNEIAGGPTEFWSTYMGEVLEVVWEVMDGNMDKPIIVKNCLAFLKELLDSQTQYMTPFAFDILFNTLRCEVDRGLLVDVITLTTALQSLIATILTRFEPILGIRASLKCIHTLEKDSQINPYGLLNGKHKIQECFRVCFELLGGFVGRIEEMNKASGMSVVQLEGEVLEDLLAYCVKGLLSRSSHIRKPAYESILKTRSVLIASVTASGTVDVSMEELYQAFTTKALAKVSQVMEFGSEGERIVKTELVRKLIEKGSIAAI